MSCIYTRLFLVFFSVTYSFVSWSVLASSFHVSCFRCRVSQGSVVSQGSQVSSFLVSVLLSVFVNLLFLVLLESTSLFLLSVFDCLLSVWIIPFCVFGFS